MKSSKWTFSKVISNRRCLIFNTKRWKCCFTSTKKIDRTLKLAVFSRMTLKCLIWFVRRTRWNIRGEGFSVHSMRFQDYNMDFILLFPDLLIIHHWHESRICWMVFKWWCGWKNVISFRIFNSDIWTVFMSGSFT